MELLTDEIPSELGKIVIVAHEQRLLSLDYHDYDDRMLALLAARYGGTVALRPAPNPFGLSDRLRAYLAGDLAAVEAIPVETGGTPFQRQVWAALRRIPAGTTISYADLAREVGRPTATRAVGMINGRNPVAIVVPCHRVIGKDSSLTGYAGGLHRKRWLLRHEGVAVGEDRTAVKRRRTGAQLQTSLPFDAVQEAAQ
jgi:methylated-DNA-[protein]-cysteine S-methyltransferase